MNDGFTRKLKGSGTIPVETTVVSPEVSLRRFLTGILPQVSRELKLWNRQLDHCNDWSLMRQAVLSLQSKRFHAQGGSFYALYNPQYSRSLVSLIVALQTISDYLDNLCDRGGVYDEAAFRCLHHAVTDALNTGSAQDGRDYYRFYPSRNDGGYLQALVKECRGKAAQLPSYGIVQPEILRLASLYNDLQVYKHLNPRIRHSRLKRWYREKGVVVSPAIYFWEFAAACGSTLAVFALFGLATSPYSTDKEVRQVVKAYFPWVCGLHILLDYWIDQEEDRRGGDFNFAACYPSPELAAQRLHLFLDKALEGVARLPHPTFHRTIVRGLLAVYLSDPKVAQQGLQQTARSLIDAAGTETKFFHRLCLILRRTGIL